MSPMGLPFPNLLKIFDIDRFSKDYRYVAGMIPATCLLNQNILKTFKRYEIQQSNNGSWGHGACVNIL